MSRRGWRAWTVLLSRSRSFGASKRSVGAVITSTGRDWKPTPAAEQIPGSFLWINAKTLRAGVPLKALHWISPRQPCRRRPPAWAPLLQKLIQQYATTGLPPAYLPKP